MNETAKKMKKEMKFIEQAEFNRFGIMAMTLIIQSCLGSIAVCYISSWDSAAGLVLLGLVAAFTMGANAIAIVQAPMKWVIWSFASSCFVSIIVTLIGLLGS